MRAALAALCLALAGCYGTQIYPTLQEQRISLAPGDLEAGGVAFITPSTVTGQEQETQAVALVFADVLERTARDLIARLAQCALATPPCTPSPRSPSAARPARASRASHRLRSAR